jgi:hypothetical protein
MGSPAIGVGDVLRRALAVWGRVIVPLGPGCAAGVIPVVVAGFAGYGGHSAYLRTHGDALAPGLAFGGVALQVFGSAAVTCGARDVIQGDQVDVGAALAAASRRFLAL